MNIYNEPKINNINKINLEKPFIDIINQAIKILASDIHIDPKSHFYLIKFRVNGILIENSCYPIRYFINIISQLKIMANLDITESRLSQDGKIAYYFEYNQFNLRIATLPTIMGEKLTIRILNNSKKLLSIDKIGVDATQQKIIQDAINQESGLILFTGATGSGKTTSMYACVKELITQKNFKHIISIEDPVEIQFDNINQINVNNKINLTFANILKAILRQDPDIIIVGEIRDLETAKLALAASQTGHLVLATMHCNNANLAIKRLLDLGVPNYLIDSNINLIVFQKFLNLKERKTFFEVKKICI